MPVWLSRKIQKALLLESILSPLWRSCEAHAGQFVCQCRPCEAWVSQMDCQERPMKCFHRCGGVAKLMHASLNAGRGP